MNAKNLWSILLILLGASLAASQSLAQTITFSEDFTRRHHQQQLVLTSAARA